MNIRIGVHNNNPSLFFLSRLDHVLDTFDEPLELYFYADGTRTGDLLAEGAIDFGGTGSSPPLTAQAAGLPIVYAAASAPLPDDGGFVTGTGGPRDAVPQAAPARSVFFTRRDFAESRPDAVAALVRALKQADDWAKVNLREAAHLIEEAVGGSVDAWETTLARLPWRLEPVGAEFIAEQQEAADVLYAANVLQRPIDVSQAVVPGLELVVAEVLNRNASVTSGAGTTKQAKMGTTWSELSKAGV
ncbi:MAG: sulfonate transporter substrate-binding protein [Sphaerisporangium sp.]|nr:sulfonate transporter substrate-binding protein [Sphaerisporangium sp.]